MAKQTIHHVDQLMEDVAYIAAVLAFTQGAVEVQHKLMAITKRWDGAKAKGVASDEAYMMEAANTAPPPVQDAPKPAKAKPAAKPEAPKPVVKKRSRWL